MAANLKLSSHTRSSSFPSRTHPFTTQVEEQLKRLRSTEGTSSSALAACQKAEALKVLYDSMDDWLQLPLTQQALSHESQRQDIDNLLDGSLTTIDFCGTVRDVLSQMKETIQQLESSLRRRGDSTDDISTYLALRKKITKMICKSLRSMEKNNASSGSSNGDAAVSMAREVEQISLSVFKSLLSFVSRPKVRSNSWSVVSKVLSSKRVTCNDETDTNEVEDLDAELVCLKSANVKVCTVLRRLEALESTIQEIEAAVECVFRGLLKSRVSLLNILNC